MNVNKRENMEKKTWAHLMVEKALNNPQPLLLELDAENDELSVRRRLVEGKYSTWQAGVAEEWLRLKSEERASEIEARSEASEEQILSIAKEANRLASEANSIARSQAAAAWRASRYAMYAAVIAAIVAIVTNKSEILNLINS